MIDESLTGLDALVLAREMGYTGVALKACKEAIADAVARSSRAEVCKGCFGCVQDLTCPGAALVHSVGIAAHIPGTSALEANALASMFLRRAKAGRSAIPASSTFATAIMRHHRTRRPRALHKLKLF